MLHVILRPPFDELQPYKVHGHVFGDTETTETVSPKCVRCCAHFEIGQSTSAVPIGLVQSVWADKTELDLIYRSFEGIPKRFHRHADHDQTSKWFGDDAKFIVANWT